MYNFSEISNVRFFKNISLSRHTTIKIGGSARILTYPEDEWQLVCLLKFSLKNKLPILVLGGGSNAIISDNGFPGVVICLAGSFCVIEKCTQGKGIIAGAGASLSSLTKLAISMGFAEAIGWIAIPGKIGGAVVMNSGTRYGCIWDVIDEIEGFVFGEKKILKAKEVVFGYRATNLPKELIITKIRISSRKRVSCGYLRDKGKHIANSRAILYPRLPSAGSVFKNPDKHYAGRLIELSGLKGLRLGNAAVSSIHANFIVNEGNATSLDVVELIKIVRKSVMKKFNILLSCEVKFFGLFEKNKYPK